MGHLAQSVAVGFTLVVTAAHAQGWTPEEGPSDDNGPIYSDYPRFVREMTLICHAPELSGSERVPAGAKRNERLAEWMRAQAFGTAATDLLVLIHSYDALSYGLTLLESAQQASIARCPLAEHDLRSLLQRLRARCKAGDRVACETGTEVMTWIEDSVTVLAYWSEKECEWGVQVQCGLPTQYQKLLGDLRAGRPGPRASKEVKALVRKRSAR